MKKFIMITPPSESNQKIASHLSMSFIEKHITDGEEIRVITITLESTAKTYEKQLQDGLTSLQEEKNFICGGIETIPITSEVKRSSVEIFLKLLPFFEEGDTLYAYVTHAITPNAMAIIMALEYAVRCIKDISIGAIMWR